MLQRIIKDYEDKTTRSKMVNECWCNGSSAFCGTGVGEEIPHWGFVKAKMWKHFERFPYLAYAPSELCMFIALKGSTLRETRRSKLGYGRGGSRPVAGGTTTVMLLSGFPPLLCFPVLWRKNTVVLSSTVEKTQLCFPWLLSCFQALWRKTRLCFQVLWRKPQLCFQPLWRKTQLCSPLLSCSPALQCTVEKTTVRLTKVHCTVVLSHHVLFSWNLWWY